MSNYTQNSVFPDQRKHQSSAALAFVRGIHRWPVNSPHKGPVTWKLFPFDDVIMLTQTSHRWCAELMMQASSITSFMTCLGNCMPRMRATASSSSPQAMIPSPKMSFDTARLLNSQCIGSALCIPPPNGMRFWGTPRCIIVTSIGHVCKLWWRHQFGKNRVQSRLCHTVTE